MRQYRGCSRLVYAIETVSEGTTSFGTVKTLAPVKSVSREIASENEKVFGDNVLQEIDYAATQITRSFDVTRIDPAVVADLLGQSKLTLGTGADTSDAYMEAPDGSTRPFIAIGYALHDGDVDTPCEVVWAYHCKVNSISKTSNTIDDGTGSEGQTIEITNFAPEKAWTQTGKRNLDFSWPIDDGNKAKVNTFFAQVVTPDNAGTILYPTI